MKKLSIISFLLLLLDVTAVSAQGWKWATGSSTDVGGIIETWPVAVDSIGNVYEIGFAQRTTQSTFGTIVIPDSFGTGEQGLLVSTDSNGAYRWAIGTQNGSVFFDIVKTDPFGNVYVIGYNVTGYFTFGGVADNQGGHFCLKVNSAGVVQWIKPLLFDAYNVNGIAVTSGGNFFITGTYEGPTYTLGGTILTNADVTGSTTDCFFMKFDSSGNFLWGKGYGGSGMETVAGISIANDSEIYIAGTSQSPSMIFGHDTLVSTSASPFYVAKYDGSGNPRWARMIQGATTNNNIQGISTGELGSVYFGGNFGSGSLIVGPDTVTTILSFQMFMAKYDSSGNAQWVKCLHGPFTELDAVAADNCGNVWGCGPYYSTTSHTDKMFIVEFDYAGNLQDTIALPSGGDDGNAVTIDYKGNVYVGGDYGYSPFIIGMDTLTNPDSSETMFILKYHYDSSTCTLPIALAAPVPEFSGPGIALYPNPAWQQCTIHSGDEFTAGAKVDIYDVTGRILHTYALSGNNTIIPLSDMPGGMYECRIFNPGYGTETRKLVVMK